MMTKRTIVDQREITSNGIIQIRFRKEILEDGEVISFGYHRTSLRPGDDLSRLLIAINEHLARMSCVAVDEASVSSIQRIVDVEHTPEVVAAFKVAQSKKEE